MVNFLKFKPIYKEKIWGGRKMESLGRTLPSGKIGESWEISDYRNDISQIDGGEYDNLSFREVYIKNPIDILGIKFRNKAFPLLVKIIDANEKLSVQVHPDFDYSRDKDPGNPSKKESWLILDALENSEIVCGFSRSLSREEYRKQVLSNQAEKDLKYWKTSRDDCFLIEPGTIHAIGPGNLILEIQESSDSTYRVYDYGRLGDDGKPRDLQLEKALDVLKFESSKGDELLKPIRIQDSERERYTLTSNDRFRIETMEFKGKVSIPSMYNLPTFQLLSVLDGRFQIEDQEIRRGETILLTATGMEKGVHISTDINTKIAISGIGNPEN